jgi:hypothetical protein
LQRQVTIPAINFWNVTRPLGVYASMQRAARAAEYDLQL